MSQESLTTLTPNRTVFCEDAIEWLQKSPIAEGCSFVTSLPDFSEFPKLTLEEWKTWFVNAAQLVIEKCPPEGVAIFFQTDIKHEGHWVDKGYLCQKAAEQAGAALLWHKVVCRVAPGHITFGRPAYSHFLCFSKGVTDPVAQSKADVLPEAGEVTWTRGMGQKACDFAAQYILENTITRTLIDPFCGHGSALAAANRIGLNAIGVELGVKRAARARTLGLSD